MKVLITGSSGFLAQHIISKLNSFGHQAICFSRSNNTEDLIGMIKQSDYCFHLAGEVRPKASSKDFNDSNVNFTKKILNYLQTYNPVPIVFSSTIHAGHTNNDYGNSKLLAEQLIKIYGIDNIVPTHIYRLPHLFGIGAKENYNSVFTTWVFRALRGEDLIVFDYDFMMHYIQVDELSHTFVQQLINADTLPLPQTYNISLGDLKQRIQMVSSLKSAENLNKFDSYIFDMFQDARKRVG